MTSPARPGVDEMVRELWDRQQISDVMLRFGRGLDLHDWELYAATLTDPFEVDFVRPHRAARPRSPRPRSGPGSPAPAWNGWWSCTSTPTSTSPCAATRPTASSTTSHGTGCPTGSGDDHYTQYGWYENSFRRTADGWKISRLKHTFQWCDGNPTLIDVSDPAWQEAAAAVFGPA